MYSNENKNIANVYALKMFENVTNVSQMFVGVVVY